MRIKNEEHPFPLFDRLKIPPSAFIKKTLIRSQRMQATEMMFRILKLLCFLNVFDQLIYWLWDKRSATYRFIFWYGFASLLILL